MAYTNPIEEDLKQGVIRPFYLIFGTEEYLKDQYAEKLKKAVLADDSGMNFSLFEGDGISVDEIIETAQTMPFFAERRLVLIRESGFFKSPNEEMLAFLTESPSTTCILFQEKEVDKRGRMFKYIQKEGCAAEFSELSADLLSAWIRGRLKKEGLVISPRTVSAFLDRCGTDMNLLSQEMEKLISYTAGRDEITEEDLKAVTTRQIEGHIFDMIDAATGRNQKRALSLYYDLLALKEPPLRILSLIHRQYRILLIVKDMKEKKMRDQEMAKQAEVPPFAIRKYAAIAGKLKREEIREALGECADLEESVKTGLIGDQLGVELFLIAHSA